MNHTTVVPKDAPAEERNTIDYDADSAHDRYMCSLRLDMVRSGTINVNL